MFSTDTFGGSSVSRNLSRYLHPNMHERLRLYDIFRAVSLQSRLCDILHVRGNIYSVHGNIRGNIYSVHGNIRGSRSRRGSGLIHFRTNWLQMLVGSEL
jgi:hypothetical protein